MPEPITILDLLRRSLAKGGLSLGQVSVQCDYTLHHVDDAGRPDLFVSIDPNEAVEIAKYDDAGHYRPLKTAPNLRHGWILRLASLEEVHQALDFLYPAALGLWRSWRQARLTPVPLRDTLARQTGMYAVVKKITDQEIPGLKDRVCNSQTGCLRRVLWPVSGDLSAPSAINASVSQEDFSLLCAEACNLLIAEGRKLVKARLESSG